MVCSSVFQLYVAILIKKVFYNDKEVDLVLTDATPRFETLSKSEKLSDFFHCVYFAEICKNEEALNRLQRSKYGRMFFEIFPCQYVKKIWGLDVKKYAECYFSSFTLQNLMLQYAIKKNGENTKIHMFEDGISTYIVKNGQTIRTPQLFRKIFRICSIEEVLDDVYVFAPELVCLKEYKNLVVLPKPQEIEGLYEIYNEVFGRTDYQIKEKFIFFEESFNNDGYITNDTDLINMLWKECEEKDFVLKHHPRNKVDRFKTILPTIEAPIFWENYLLNNSIDNKVLVTISSNTVFIPHIISNAKPKVVMLYKIFNGTSPILGSGNFETYVERYLKYYEEYTKNKFYIPETMEEFQNIIKKLKTEIEA